MNYEDCAVKLADIKNSFIIDKDRIILVKDGFKSSSKKEPLYIKKLMDKYDGFVGEIRLDLKSDDKYSIVTNIHVVDDMRRKGIAKRLYNKALSISKKSNKLGIGSYEYMRNTTSNKVWEKYSQGFDEEMDMDIITREIK